jgi:hypothetical protein
MATLMKSGTAQHENINIQRIFRFAYESNNFEIAQWLYYDFNGTITTTVDEFCRVRNLGYLKFVQWFYELGKF